MKLFVLLSRVPWPLEKGDKLRAYHQLKGLARKHEIFLCCLSDQKIHPQAFDHLKLITPNIEVVYLNKFLIGWRLFTALFSSEPFQVRYFYQHRAAKKIEAAISKFAPDHIYCQLIRTSEYIKNLHQYRKTIDYMDALSAGSKRRAASSSFFEKWFFNEESKRLMNYENLIFDYFDHHTIISKQDLQLIYHPKRSSITVIPNGVDNEYFKPKDSIKKYDLLFTGNMSYAPNVASAELLAKEILPIVLRELPDTKLLIAGANPAPAVLSLASNSIIVSGWMEDIRLAYLESRLFVAPMFNGSGMQNKLLEAMCMRMPCITSPLAAAAFDNATNNTICMAVDQEEFAAQIIKMLKNAELAATFAIAGYNFVRSGFNWEHSTQLLNETICAQLPFTE